jgi:3-methyladenine DNA glycosylase AlkD
MQEQADKERYGPRHKRGNRHEQPAENRHVAILLSADMPGRTRTAARGRTATQAAATAAVVRRALRAQAHPDSVSGVTRFFKCGRGEYGEGDEFIGVTVPAQRAIAREFRHLPLAQAEALLTSRIHEERLTALLILVDQFNRAADDRARGRIFRLYMQRLRFINNWDLVDTSAGFIVGGWLADKPRDLLDRLARSKNLWSRRVAMIATSYFISRGDHRDAVRLATILVNDSHDLIHKAVGWMLRQVGTRASAEALDNFLEQHAATMPRTMLRYAIEHRSPAERLRWMRMSKRHGERTTRGDLNPGGG